MGTDTAPQTPLGILAGGGLLPRRIADTVIAAGRPVFLIGFHGQTDPASIEDFPHVWARLGESGRVIAALKGADVVDVVMVGPVRRPSWSEIGLDWHGAQLIARIGARALGDDSLLSAVAGELESEGFHLIGAHKFLVEGFVEAGQLGRFPPDEQARSDIARGVEVARALGAVDVGQSVVVQQGMVLGVEAIEGTDALIERVAGLRRAGAGGVLVKIAKPGQDRRMDLPTIGPNTIAAVAAAGLRGVAIEAGATIVVDRGLCITRADDSGLFILGLTAREIAGQ